jgi:endonuclease/exonuclease/phosphatase family metal-dependent hydrolase
MKISPIIQATIMVTSCLLFASCANTKNSNNSSENQFDTGDEVRSASLAVKSTKLPSVATWNVEHLASPFDSGCKPRSEKELLELQQYARNIQADVVGLQEVASKEAVHLLFPASEWRVVMSQRADSDPYVCRGSGRNSTQQKVAFAVRKSIDVVKVIQHEAFSLNSPGLRRGLEIQIPSSSGTISILNVHMKSGCFVDNYSRAKTDACDTFAKQAPLLDAWVEDKEKRSLPYIMVGDFNHRLSAPYNHLTRQLFTNTNKNKSTLLNATAHLIGCHEYYPAPIDHIFVGYLPNQNISLITNIYRFNDMQPNNMLSDHCAISLSFDQQETF